jgi:hypothetical protein
VLSIFCLCIAAIAYTGLPFPAAGSAALGALAVLGCAVSVGAAVPELLVAACGASIGQAAILFGPLGIGVTSIRYTVGVGVALFAGVFIRGVFLGESPRRPRLDIWAVAVAALSIAIIGQIAFRRTWIPGDLLLMQYLSFGLFSSVWIWWGYLSTVPDISRTVGRVVLASAWIKGLGLALNVVTSSASLRPLLDFRSDFWTVQAGRLTLGDFDPITIAMEFAVPVVVTCLAFVYRSDVGRMARVLVSLVAVRFTALVIATGTRQALIGLLAAAYVVHRISRRKTPIAGRGTVLALILLIALLPLAENALGPLAPLVMRSREGFGDASASLVFSRGRVNVLLEDTIIALGSPLLGKGVGFSSTNNSAKPNLSHNLFASVAVEVGILPAALLAACVFSAWRAAESLARRSPAGPRERFVVAACSGLFVSNLVWSMASGRLEGGLPWFCWGFALAMMAVPPRRTVPQQ